MVIHPLFVFVGAQIVQKSPRENAIIQDLYFDKISKDDIEKAFIKICKYQTLPYPIFSSKTVKGKPLFVYAKEGSLDSIEIPHYHVNVHKHHIDEVSEDEILGDYIEDIIETVELVSGDFRQKMITTAWAKQESNHIVRKIVATFTVGSGTYIRSLVHEVGKELGVGGCCVKITRTRIY